MKLFQKPYSKYVIGSIIILAVPLIFYWCNFGTFRPSKSNFSDWRAFSEFFGLYITMVSVFIATILTIKIIDISEANNNLQKNLEKPIISFIKEKNSHYYAIKNVGAGAAINITLYKRLERPESEKYEDKFDCYKIFYSLGSNESKDEEEFTQQANLLAALYNDIFGDTHFSLMNFDTLLYGKIKELDILNGDIQKELREKYEWIKANPNPQLKD